MVRDKVRIRFRKAGDLRWTSHHDLLRCFERMLRRAALPYNSSEGFNPHPRLVFALPLPLGVVGENELVDLELGELLPPEDIHSILARQAPPGLSILDVQRVDARARLHPNKVVYRLSIPERRQSELRERAASLLAGSECRIERTKPTPRQLDIRPFILDLCITPTAIELHLAVTTHGSARPDEVLRALGLGDLLEAGACLERTRVELSEDTTPEAIPLLFPLTDSCSQEKDSHEKRDAD